MTVPANAWYIASSGSNIYTGVWSSTMNYSEGVYRSTNNGLNFALVGLNNKPVFDLAGDSQQLVAIALEMGMFKVFRSTNGGTNWVNIMGNLNLGVTNLALNGNKIYAGDQGLHVTTNYGTNWNSLFMGDNVESILANDSLIILGTYSKGIYRSTDNGQSWLRTLNLDKRIYCVCQYGQNIFAGGDTGFYVSTDLGSTFTDRTELLGNARISSIVIHNNYIFVSNSNYLSTNISAWRRPLSQIIGINQLSHEIPAAFSLLQNFPNPFNPVTKIRFDVPKTSSVVIKVFDILGKEIAVLVNEQLTSGTFETEWDAASCASGLYFYRMTAGDFIQTKKMALIR
jgi:Secretion system C-terminal sorting domain